MLAFMLACGLNMQAMTKPFGNGRLTVTIVARNAVRIQYAEGKVKDDLPDWIYVKHDEVKSRDIKVDVEGNGQPLV